MARVLSDGDDPQILLPSFAERMCPETDGERHGTGGFRDRGAGWDHRGAVEDAE